MIAKLKQLLTSETGKKIRNLIYSIGATVVFNMVLQLLVYPSFERRMGPVDYGVALSASS